MPSVEELLSVAEADVDTRSAIDSRIEIDADTRIIRMMPQDELFGVESDEKSERKYFKVPKIVGNGVDLSKLQLRINYQNASKIPSGKDMYIVKDATVYNDEWVYFSWELSRKVTQYKGNIYFIVCAVKADSNGNITNEWNTTLAEGKVLEGLEVETNQEQQYQASDYLEQLKQQLLDYSKEIKDTFPSDYTQMQDDIGSLKSDLLNYDTYLKSYLEVDADFVSENGKLFNLVNRDEASLTNSCYIKQIIPIGINRVKVSGKSASAKYNFDLGAFYKADDTLISRFGNVDLTEYTDYEVEVPNGTAYMIINQNDTPSSSYKKASFFTSRVIKDDISGLKDDVSVPVEIEADEVNNACWNVVDKNTAGSGCHTKTFVDGYNTILVSGKSASAKYNFPLGAFYKADDTLISRFGNDDLTEYTDLIVKVPNEASYVIVNQKDISVTEYRKIKALIPNNIYENLVKPLENRVSVLESKSSEDTLLDNTEFALFHTWGLIGDSLSVGHTRSADGSVTNGRNIYYSWGQYLARRLGNNCLNFGKSGISAKTWMSDSLCYERLIDSDNLCQGYIIALGANDTSMTLGSIDDVNFEDMSQNADTEYGWYAKVINAVRTISQDVPIFLFTLPHPRNSDANIQAINEMIRTFANDKEHFGKIFLVDLDADYNDYFKNGKLQSQIGNTGWHLTSLGYLYASHVNQKALSKVISDNYSDFQDVFMLPYGNNTILD